MSIYVEAFIRGPLEEVWRLTQTPELHERWDLRFSSITYLDRDDETNLQRFRYATRIGFGMQIEGWGETVGDRRTESQRTSALKFGSEDWRSLIRSGSGYWKYEQVNGGVRFITGYDYEVRWGPLGRLIDLLLFRPLMGWATAWSFDRLRLWIENGAEPRASVRLASLHWISAAAISILWIGMGAYLLNSAAPGVGSTLRNPASGEPTASASSIQAFMAGVALVMGPVILPFARNRGAWIASFGAVLALATFLIPWSAAPDELGLRAAVLFLAILPATLCWMTLNKIPRAGRCLRRPTRISRKEGDR